MVLSEYPSRESQWGLKIGTLELMLIKLIILFNLPVSSEVSFCLDIRRVSQTGHVCAAIEEAVAQFPAASQSIFIEKYVTKSMNNDV